MILQDYLNEDQVDLCKETGIIIEDRDYSCEEIYDIEHKLMEYLNNNCTNENIYLLEEKYDEILDILMDLENESDQINPLIVEINEDDHVKLTNGKTGIVADITNNVYTIDVDTKYKTGNIDDDIMIVDANSIIGKIA